MKPDPIGNPRNPFQVFLFVICVVNGAALALGFDTSSALDQNLPLWGEIGYGAILVIGALLVLIGMYWQGSRPTGLLLKRIGYLALAISAFIYGLAVVSVPGSTAIFAGTVCLAFSGLCAWQVHAINRITKAIIAVKEDSAAIDEVAIIRADQSATVTNVIEDSAFIAVKNEDTILAVKEDGNVIAVKEETPHDD